MRIGVVPVLFLALLLSGSASPSQERAGYINQLEAQAEGVETLIQELRPIAVAAFDTINGISEREAYPSCGAWHNVDAHSILGYIQALKFKEKLAQNLQSALMGDEDSIGFGLTHEWFTLHMRAREVSKAFANFLLLRAAACRKILALNTEASHAGASLLI